MNFTNEDFQYDKPFNRCCYLEVFQIWKELIPENIICYDGRCPTCGHYIGLTPTTQEEIALVKEEFTRDFGEII